MSIGEHYHYLNLDPDLIRKTKETWYQFKLSIGNQIIDIQHIWLIYLVTKSEAISNIHKSKDGFQKKMEVQSIIDECYNYTKEHFSVEEELIQLIDHKFQIHRSMHQGFLKKILSKLDEIKDAKEVEVHQIANDMHSFLRNWLLEHIAIYDKEIMIILQKHEKEKELVRQWSKQIKEKNQLKITTMQLDLFNIIQAK